MPSLLDAAAEVVETCLRMLPLPTRTGVRAVGNPGRSSPVLLTGNYDLTVRRVVRALGGVDAWLVVASSRGVNVWCAASGGHLGTHQVVTALKLAGLEDRVFHREVILPQLAATGVEAKEVRRRTGWIARFGPADARDIPAYLAAGKRKDAAMRRVRFGLRERLEMAVAWAAPISAVVALAAALFARRWLGDSVAMVWAIAVAAFLVFDRMPWAESARRALLAAGASALAIAALWAGGSPTALAALGWSAFAGAIVWLVTFDFAGSSPTAAAGIFEERLFEITLDRDRCAGAWNCLAVCPEDVFEKRPAERKIAIASPERCIRCGACIVQCPQDALSFAAPDGRRVPPETIRRFKLNLLGKRAVRPVAPELQAGEKSGAP
jgi:NAD-dependent dihydropyrimidine dehydrogenase PreA subunit